LLADAMRRPQTAAAALGGDTTYLCATDRDGNAISLIQSIFAAFGSRVIAGDTGVILNNRLCSFGLDPSKANALRAGKRPAHTLNTYMVFNGGEFFAVGGSPGADEQPQTNLQVLHNLLDLDMDPQQQLKSRAGVISRARRRGINFRAVTHESGIDSRVIDDLRKDTRFLSWIVGLSAAPR
jgi:gamma-glutamyltranspeptidase/glutathione hydrolase